MSVPHHMNGFSFFHFSFVLPRLLCLWTVGLWSVVWDCETVRLCESLWNLIQGQKSASMETSNAHFITSYMDGDMMLSLSTQETKKM